MMHPSEEQLRKMKDDLSRQRWEDFANGLPQYKPSFPTKPYLNVAALPKKDPISNEWEFLCSTSWLAS